MATGIPTSDHTAARAAADAVRVLAPRLGEHDGPAIVSVSVPDIDPLVLWRAFPDLDATYWRSPLGDPVASVGCLRRVPAGPYIDAEVAERELAEIAGQLLHLDARTGVSGESEESASDSIRLFGGTMFHAGQNRGEWAGFGSGDFVLPAWCLERGEQGSVLRVGVEAPVSDSALETLGAEVAAAVAHIVEQTGMPDPRFSAIAPAPRTPAAPSASPGTGPLETWVETVEVARAAMREGRLEKVVLCRRCELTFDDAADPIAVLGHLSSRTGEYVFGLRRGGRTFLGASPELLLAKRGPHLRTEALAGTCRIDRAGDRHAELAHAAERLFGSGKDLEEHALVVRGIVEALEPLVSRRVLPAWPEVRAFKDLAHLCSEIEAELRADVGPLAVLRALHPTPAVGGLPRDAALRFLSDVEPVERGWYAGPVGWLSPGGDAEIAVGIRSALLADDVAWLYAGAGILQASDPEAEFRETEDKLGRLSSALGVEEISK